MLNAIQFLESQGQNPALNLRSAEAYAEVVEALQIDEAQRRALRDRDAGMLSDLVGGRKTMLCLILSPEEEPLQREDDQDGDGPPPEAPPEEK